MVGIECGARGWALALRLLVGGSLLAALRLHRFGFALGVLRVLLHRRGLHVLCLGVAPCNMSR